MSEKKFRSKDDLRARMDDPGEPYESEQEAAFYGAPLRDDDYTPEAVNRTVE